MIYSVFSIYYTLEYTQIYTNVEKKCASMLTPNYQTPSHKPRIHVGFHQKLKDTMDPSTMK